MRLTYEEVQKIANLARIRLKEEETEKYREELSAILDYVNQLREVDVEREADLHILNEVNKWREDEVRLCPSEEQKLILENMPIRENDKLKTVGVFRKD